jgi:hypothetical protein
MIGGYLVAQIDKASIPIVCMIDLVLCVLHWFLSEPHGADYTLPHYSTVSEVLGEQRGAKKTKGAEGREEQYGEVCSEWLLAAPGGTGELSFHSI